MADVNMYRNREEKEKAKKDSIIDTEGQTKRSKEYLKRLEKKLKELKND